MALTGATGGLFAWAIAALASATLMHQQRALFSDLISTLTIGAIVGGMTIACVDHCSGEQMHPWRVASGVAIGILAAAIGNALEIPVTRSVAGQFPGLARVLCWILVGSLIGLGLGLRWLNTNRYRAPYAFTGGLLGGGLSGLLFTGFGSRGPDFVQALAFVVTGTGISLGIGLAPVLVQHGLLQFISSGDVRAQRKLGRGHKEWTLAQGLSYTIGSQEPATSKRSVESGIFIPDAAVAPRHAVIFGRQGRFYLARHPDIGGQAGLARFVLRLRGRTVVKAGELRDSDDILIGRTALKFISQDLAGFQ